MTNGVPAGSRASDAILSRLHELHPKLIDLSLGRIETLLAALGRPETKLPPVFHVAGTNGKGSTVAFLKAILEAAGKSVHVYTSPHLVRFHERIALKGAPIDERQLAETLDRCEKANAGRPITFFEITTAAAFLAFSETPADAVVLEVGLGGRLDATNVIARPAAALIAPVGIDHTEYLGPTIGAIAAEKAGILKPGAPAFIAAQPVEAHETIAARAEAIGVNAHWYGTDFLASEERERMIYQDTDGLLDLPRPALFGAHQIANAALAIAALRGTRIFPLGEAEIGAGLGTVRWPARLQRLTRGPLAEQLPAGAELWLDGAHNVMGAEALASAARRLAADGRRPLYLIAAILKRKDAKGILAPFRGLTKSVFAVPMAGNEGAYTAAELKSLAEGQGFAAAEAGSAQAAIARICEDHAAAAPGAPGPVILLMGSLYFAGEILGENS